MRTICLAIGLLAGLLAPASAAGISRVLDVAYLSDGLAAHRLDLFVPEHPQAAPLVVFIHGGAFMYGDRKDYDPVGEALAREGVAVAVVSYRSYPQADAYGAISDVAASIAWMHRHARDYGLASGRLFLVGHSSGAQIAAVLATNPEFLSTVSLQTTVLNGIFAISGPYDVRDLSNEDATWQAVDRHIYGDDRSRAKISPVANLTHHSLIPFELACGTDEDPFSCRQADLLASALRSAGEPASVFRESGVDHMGMVRAMATYRDPLNDALLNFVL